MARDAGSWRGIAEGKDIVIRQLEGEIERLRADVARCEASLVAWVEAVGECNEDRNRLREALEDVLKVPRSDAAYGVIRCIARDALGESDA